MNGNTGNAGRKTAGERRRPWLLLMVLAALLLGPSCVTTEPQIGYLEELGPGGRGRGASDRLTGTAYWDGDHTAGAPFLVVDLTKQEALFYKGDTLVGMSPVSSGQEGRNTPSGDYKILEKDIDHFSNSYGRIVDTASGRTVNPDATPKSPVPPGGVYEPAPMPNFMRLTWDGVGMHEGYLPGYPASHGCIRMDAEMSRRFFENVKVGTLVRVVR